MHYKPFDSRALPGPPGESSARLRVCGPWEGKGKKKKRKRMKRKNEN